MWCLGRCAPMWQNQSSKYFEVGLEIVALLQIVNDSPIDNVQ